MKQIGLLIKMSLIIAIMVLSQNSIAQCLVAHNQNGTNVFTSEAFLWGQTFIAECDGELEYVQYISDETGVVSAGTLSIYDGNTVSDAPIYTQSHPAITINQINDPIRVYITSTLNLVQGNQYTFEFTVDNVDILADFNNGYSGGTPFQNGTESPTVDLIFEVSILNSTLSENEFSEATTIRLFPNPLANYVVISNLKETQKYSIVNALGQEVLKGKLSNNERIDVQNLISGLYYLKLKSGITLKFIKK